MKNTMYDLRNHLFESLERLRETGPEGLDEEIQKAKAISETAGKLIDTAKVEVEYLKVTGEEAEGSKFLTPRIGHED